MTEWWNPAPVLQTHEGVVVVRDDLVPGGSKARFLPYLIEGASEVVFGGPFCGGAPYALAILGQRLGIRVTLFYAARKVAHPLQTAAQAAGARLEWVEAGRMGVVQARAREYAAKAGALFLPLGFDVPAAEAPYVEAMGTVRGALGGPPAEVWCATGSGMLARCLGRAFPEAAVFGVTVGLASRHGAQALPPNVRLVPTFYRFEQAVREEAPFPCHANYDRKAWLAARAARRRRRASGTVLFWNVLW
jgi:Pyridoxal-phosphate dependent enzyme